MYYRYCFINLKKIVLYALVICLFHLNTSNANSDYSIESEFIDPIPCLISAEDLSLYYRTGIQAECINLANAYCSRNNAEINDCENELIHIYRKYISQSILDMSKPENLGPVLGERYDHLLSQIRCILNDFEDRCLGEQIHFSELEYFSIATTLLFRLRRLGD